MKFILMICLIVFSLKAFEHNMLLLRAQASMFPKILLLDKEIEDKRKGSKILFTIVYDEDELYSAEKLKELLLEKTQKKLGGYDFDVELLMENSYVDSHKASAYYLFSTQSKTKKRVISNAQKSKRVCYSYDYRDFSDGSLLSLHLKEKTYIYLNKSSLLDYNIKFNPILYKVVKVQ